jgi:uncharacterized membrane protein YczE
VVSEYPPVEVTMRLRSPEYGDGTIVAVLGIGIQVRWDTPILGTTQTHMLVHDPVFIAKLERI